MLVVLFGTYLCGSHWAFILYTLDFYIVLTTCCVNVSFMVQIKYLEFTSLLIVFFIVFTIYNKMAGKQKLPLKFWEEGPGIYFKYLVSLCVSWYSPCVRGWVLGSMYVVHIITQKVPLLYVNFTCSVIECYVVLTIENVQRDYLLSTIKLDCDESLPFFHSTKWYL